VFVATGGRAVPLGVSAQLVGEAAFGTAGYRYCGNILATSPSSDMALVKHACALTAAVADEFQLVGVNGIDFIARGSVPHPIEVNPRWCASMELVERAYGLSVFGAHAAACTAGTLPEFDVGCARSRWGAVGKAVVFARRTVTVGDTRAWLPAEVSSVVGRGRREVDETGLDDLGASIRDVPHPGGRIEAGRPVCTVFAAGRDVAECRKVLIRRAEEIFAQLAQWEG
jgi:predicted ATP-grasp superfamily ATP-dependent carboligase